MIALKCRGVTEFCPLDPLEVSFPTNLTTANPAVASKLLLSAQNRPLWTATDVYLWANRALGCCL